MPRFSPWPPFDDHGTPAPLPTSPPGGLERDTAIAGNDGAKLETLIGTSETEGAKELWRLVKDSVKGYTGRGPLMERRAVEQFATRLAGIRAAAELLGRSRVHEMAERATEAGGLSKFAADDPFTTDAADFPQIIKAPQEALQYFRGLMPKLGIDPERWIGEQTRKAFTLAESANQVLTAKVQKIITDSIRNGEGLADATAKITRQMESVGVSPKNPQYAEMVMRTNVVDSYQTGVYQEGRNPAIAGMFPVWQYIGIRDGRQGKDHEIHFELYYPDHATFADVRGPRPYNCRCSLKWIDYMDWADLVARGATVQRSW